MIPIHSTEEYHSAKSTDKLPLKCYWCQNTFFLQKKYITYSLNHKHLQGKEKGKYCTQDCFKKAQAKTIVLTCKNCNSEIKKAPAELKKTKSSFCNKSCAATYNNSHKKIGTRRSKLESWLEIQLKHHYSNLTILFNDKTTIGSELDIYIPSLKLAFELNGIFHYQPIYGQRKFAATKLNDSKKQKSCENLNINLHILDISKQIRFSPENSKNYLEYICKTIDSKNNNQNTSCELQA
jgi:hypothetical protein